MNSNKRTQTDIQTHSIVTPRVQRRSGVTAIQYVRCERHALKRNANNSPKFHAKLSHSLPRSHSILALMPPQTNNKIIRVQICSRQYFHFFHQQSQCDRQCTKKKQKRLEDYGVFDVVEISLKWSIRVLRVRTKLVQTVCRSASTNPDNMLLFD